MTWGVKIGFRVAVGVGLFFASVGARAENLQSLVKSVVCNSALSGMTYRLSIHRIDINGGEWEDVYGIVRNGEVIDGMGEPIDPERVPEIEIPREDLQLEIVTETPSRHRDRLPMPGILPTIPDEGPVKKKDEPLPN